MKKYIQMDICAFLALHVLLLWAELMIYIFFFSLFNIVPLPIGILFLKNLQLTFILEEKMQPVI